jgi:hypothetical protein
VIDVEQKVRVEAKNKKEARARVAVLLAGDKLDGDFKAVDKPRLTKVEIDSVTEA